MTEMPLLDRAKLEELHDVGRMTEMPLVRTLLTAYLEGLPASIARLHAAALGGDADTLKITAHSLKSSSAQLGAARLAAICLRIEHASPAAATPLLETLDLEVAAVRPLFEAERDRA